MAERGDGTGLGGVAAGALAGFLTGRGAAGGSGLRPFAVAVAERGDHDGGSGDLVLAVLVREASVADGAAPVGNVAGLGAVGLVGRNVLEGMLVRGDLGVVVGLAVLGLLPELDGILREGGLAVEGELLVVVEDHVGVGAGGDVAGSGADVFDVIEAPGGVVAADARQAVERVAAETQVGLVGDVLDGVVGAVGLDVPEVVVADLAEGILVQIHAGVGVRDNAGGIVALVAGAGGQRLHDLNGAGHGAAGNDVVAFPVVRRLGEQHVGEAAAANGAGVEGVDADGGSGNGVARAGLEEGGLLGGLGDGRLDPAAEAVALDLGGSRG